MRQLGFYQTKSVLNRLCIFCHFVGSKFRCDGHNGVKQCFLFIVQ